jgi:hypothetical protein
MYKFIDDVTQNPQETLTKNYTGALRTSISQMKNDCEDKLRTVNVECPKIWELRKSMKDRMQIYSSKQIERKEAEEQVRKSLHREEIKEKFSTLFDKLYKQ